MQLRLLAVAGLAASAAAVHKRDGVSAAFAGVAAKALRGKAAPPAGQLNVTLYSESLCPDCIHFETGVWSKAWTTPGIGYGSVVGDGNGIINFKMVSYGNARITPDNATITCQHGANECLYNTLESCAIAHYPSSFVPFIICLSNAASGGLSRAKAQTCATSAMFDWTALNTCWTGAEGKALDRINAAVTGHLIPAHQYVPWVTLSDEPGTGTYCDETNDCDLLIEAVCKAYTGPKPAACS